MKKNTQLHGGRILLPVLVLLIAAAVTAVLLGELAKPPSVRPPAGPETTTGARNDRDPGPTTEPTHQDRPAADPQINLGWGLWITYAGNYTGIYMEDGSNDLVSDVMMVIVHNDSDTDFQMGQIRVACGTEERIFTLTDLPAGAQVVLLEQERRPMLQGTELHAVLESPVAFSAPMTISDDRIRITGADGVLNVENISDCDITGGVYIYYKYASEDLLYGGITFRAHLQGGLKAGQMSQIPVGHYDPQGCRILRAEIYEADGA